MANMLNQLRKMTSQQMTRPANVGAALMCGVPTDVKEGAVVTGGAAAVVVAVELLSPVPTTALAVVAEAAIALAAACGIKSAIQGRHFWKAAIMGTPMDALNKDIKKAAKEEEKAKPEVVEGALDSKLRPTINKVTPWNVPEEMTEEFIRTYGATAIRIPS
jgi:hypothetical protein